MMMLSKLLLRSLCIALIAAGIKAFSHPAKSITYASFQHSSSGFMSPRNLASARRTNRGCSISTKMVLSELVGSFNVGDKVKISDNSIKLFNVKDYPDGYQVPVGKEGEIVKVITVDLRSGKPVSPNRPLLVKFEDPKFTAHFEARELQRVS